MTSPDSVAALRRYGGRIDSVSISGARSATHRTLQSKFVNSHLCGLNV